MFNAGHGQCHWCYSGQLSSAINQSARDQVDKYSQYPRDHYKFPNKIDYDLKKVRTKILADVKSALGDTR